MIDIVPAPPEWLAALVEGDDVFTRRFGHIAAPGWVGFPEALPHLLDAARNEPGSPWGPQLVVADGVLVGTGGWKGAPSPNGECELGYAVAPQQQGRGIATSFAQHLIAAGRLAGVRTVVAHTLPRESPSTGVLRNCAMRHTATIDVDDDPDVDRVWRWERWVTARTTIEPLDPQQLPAPALGGRFRTDADPTGDSTRHWAVVLDELRSRPTVGRIGAVTSRDPPGRAEISFTLDQAWRGRGLATESVRWLIDRLVADGRVAELAAVVTPSDTGSTRLLERCGFERVWGSARAPQIGGSVTYTRRIPEE